MLHVTGGVCYECSSTMSLVSWLGAIVYISAFPDEVKAATSFHVICFSSYSRKEHVSFERINVITRPCGYNAFLSLTRALHNDSPSRAKQQLARHTPRPRSS